MKTYKFLIVVTIIFTGVYSCKNQNNTAEHILEKEIVNINYTDTGYFQTNQTDALQIEMDKYNVPGVSYAVVYHNNIVLANGAGLLNAEKTDKVNNESIFQAASISKFVTSLIVHHYIEQGLLDLDTDINEYLTSWSVPENEFTKDKPVTLRLLLSHQSGIPSADVGHDKSIGVPTLAQILNGELPATNKAAKPHFMPGSQWEYSNMGFVVIQLILEEQLGMSFNEIAKKVLFEPLNMNSSTFNYPLTGKFAKMEAYPHNSKGEKKEPHVDSPAKAQGGLMTTPSDLAKLVVELSKAYQGASNKVISKNTAKNMLTAQIDLPFKFYNQDSKMALGVPIMLKENALAFIHNGYNTPGAASILFGLPESGNGIVVMTNSANGEKLYLEIVATVAKYYNWPIGEFFN